MKLSTYMLSNPLPEHQVNVSGKQQGSQPHPLLPLLSVTFCLPPNILLSQTGYLLWQEIEGSTTVYVEEAKKWLIVSVFAIVLSITTLSGWGVEKEKPYSDAPTGTLSEPILGCGMVKGSTTPNTNPERLPIGPPDTQLIASQPLKKHRNANCADFAVDWTQSQLRVVQKNLALTVTHH